MNPYCHLTINEREKIFLLHAQGQFFGYIAKQLNRAKSTISRELKRNTFDIQSYSPSKAQDIYNQRKRNKCGRKRILNNIDIYKQVKRLFLEEQWSPEEIDARMRIEMNRTVISYNTIYRGDFDEPNLSNGNRGAVRKLRDRGKTRHTNNHQERRGKIPISNTIHERPLAADERLEIGHWEANRVAGKTGKVCIVSLVDRKSYFFFIR